MGTFVLKILFTGLMAFIPNENGTKVTVLLLNAGHYHTSDGAAMQAHEQILFARAGNCTGSCVTSDSTAAQFTFRDLSPSAAATALAYALGNGSVWRVNGSDLSVQGSSLPALSVRNNVRGTDAIPTTSTQRGDFSWVADLSQICGSGCTLDPDLLANVPPSIVAARFEIANGDLHTWSVARLGSDVTPVQFKRLDGTGNASAYVQAVASWVGVDVAVPGSSIQLVESKHDGSTGRSMTLSPDSSVKVEVAVVNLPPFVPPASSNNDAPQVGKHFEMYYELLENPPAREARLVPRAASGTSVPQVSWTTVHPTSAVYSELLNRLRLDVGRSLYDRTICPPSQF